MADEIPFDGVPKPDNWEEEPIRGWNDPSRNHCAQEVPFSSPAAAALHGKIQGFVLQLTPQKKAHATFMRPLQQ